jgi:cation:H+ antiporter
LRRTLIVPTFPVVTFLEARPLMLLQLLLLAVGLSILTYGAELLVRGASRLATALRISRLVIGLTVVAFGTSAPELAVSIGSALGGKADLALGNVIGSNIFNVLAILGLSAAVMPLMVDRQLIRLHVPVMIGASLLTWGLATGGVITRLEGSLLFALLLCYIGWSIWQARRDEGAAAEVAEEVEPRLARDAALILAGLALLIGGAQILVQAAVAIAQDMGVSELVIGLTIVAAGTSLPELATSVLATLRGQREIAIGNVVGSNIFNLLGVLGLTAMIAPGGIPVAAAALVIDIPVMVAVAIVCFPVVFTRLISRREGLTLVMLYIAYATYLVMDARNHHLEDELTWVILYGVVPATALVIAIAIRDGVRQSRWDPPTS